MQKYFTDFGIPDTVITLRQTITSGSETFEETLYWMALITALWVLALIIN